MPMHHEVVVAFLPLEDVARESFVMLLLVTIRYDQLLGYLWLHSSCLDHHVNTVV
jgi:hypothetical protein